MPSFARWAAAIRTGWLVFAVLAVLTLAEFVIAVSIEANLPAMVAIALLKAGLIIQYFMHVARVKPGHEEEA